PAASLLFSSNPDCVMRSCTTSAPGAMGEVGEPSSNVTWVGSSPLPVTSNEYESTRGGSLRGISPFQRTFGDASSSVTIEPSVHLDSIMPQLFLSTSGLVQRLPELMRCRRDVQNIRDREVVHGDVPSFPILCC